jgi:hypothetical protein
MQAKGKMKKKKILETTDNSTVYKRVKRNYLYDYGVCNYCRPHRGCNCRVHYGGFAHKKLKYPSWKLVSKNRKQWQDKPLKKKQRELYWRRKPRAIDERGENRVPLDKIYVTFEW